MPFVLPADPADGDVAPASWGDDVRNSLNFLANPPACRAYRTAALTLSSGVVTPVGMDQERFDTDTMHSTVTNNSRITFNTAGLYVVGGCLTFLTGGGSGARLLGIYVNGGTKIVEAGPTATTATHGVNVMTAYNFTAGQYIELYAYEDGGANVAVNIAAAISPELWAVWVGNG